MLFMLQAFEIFTAFLFERINLYEKLIFKKEYDIIKKVEMRKYGTGRGAPKAPETALELIKFWEVMIYGTAQRRMHYWTVRRSFCCY